MALVKADGFEWYVQAETDSGGELELFGAWNRDNINSSYTLFGGDRRSRHIRFSNNNYSTSGIYTTVPSRSEYYVQMRFYHTINSNMSSGGRIIQFCANSSTSSPQVTFKYTSLAFEWGTGDYNRVGWISSTQQIIASCQWIDLLFHVKCHTSTGFIELYVNGRLYGGVYNVNTNPQNTGEISLIRFYQPFYAGVYMDDFMIWNTDADGTPFVSYLPMMFIRGCYLDAKVPDLLDQTIALLLKMDGANGSTSIPMYGAAVKNLIVVGATKNSSTQYKWELSSVYFDGSSLCYFPISNQFIFGTGQFTVEGWIYWSVVPTGPSPQTIFCCESSSNGVDKELYLLSDSSTTFKLKYGIRGDSYTTRSFTVATMSSATWYHFAVTRDASGVIRFFLGGVASSETYTDATGFNGILQFVLGGEFDYNSNTALYGVNGYIDDFRVTKNVARYTTGFTVPSAAFDSSDGSWSNVLLLVNGYGDNNTSVIVDVSDRAQLMTVFGQAAVSTLQCRFGTGSCTFDGNGSYLQTAYNTSLELLDHNFTIELHFLPRAYGKNNSGEYYSSLISKLGSTGNSWTLRLCGQSSFTSIQFLITANGTDYTTLTVNSPVITMGAWNHIFVVRSGTSLLLGLNGVIVGSATFNGSINSTLQTPVRLGAEYDGSVKADFTGHIDETRILDTVAYYSGTVGDKYNVPGNFPFPLCGVVPATTANLDKDTISDGTSSYISYSERASFFRILSAGNMPFQSSFATYSCKFYGVRLNVRTHPGDTYPWFNKYYLKTSGTLLAFTTPRLHGEYKSFRSYTYFDPNNLEWNPASLDATYIGFGRL